MKKLSIPAIAIIALLLISCPKGLDITPNSPPVVTLSIPKAVLPNGEEIICSATASDKDGDILYYSWFVDGKDQNKAAGALKFSRTPEVETEYTIKVKVNDKRENGKVETSATITVLAP